MSEPVCLWSVGAQLGEGPIWFASEQAVYFVDIKGRRLHRWGGQGNTETWPTPADVGFVAPCTNGSLILGLRSGLYRFSPETNRLTKLLDVEPDRPGNRINDGFVDARGVLWFGSMNDSGLAATGSLYSWSPAAPGPRIRDSGYIITNGPAQSPDGRTLYHNDTMARITYAFDLDPEGNIDAKREFARTAAGYPDGMAVDSEGFIWIAIWDGWRIDRYDPKGRFVASVAFPCANITKLSFGGPDLTTVFVTSARNGLRALELERQPTAGGLFAFETDVPGLPQGCLAV